MSNPNNDDSLGASIARIDERTRNILEKMEGYDKRMDSHAGKIRGLELWRNSIIVGGTVVAALLGLKGHQ